MDTTRDEPVIAHPLFPVAVEWQAGGRGSIDLGIELFEASRGVHAAHDLRLHRPVRAGDRITTRTSVAGVERRTPGAYVVTRTEATDADGAAVWETHTCSIMRGVEVDGEDRPSPVDPSDLPPFDPASSAVHEIGIDVPATAAHVYTECARIWNPIHTDASIARQAGLPAIILHGTATLAYSVSRIVGRVAQERPDRVIRISARFAQPVMLPSRIALRILGEGPRVPFDVVGPDGRPVISHGVLELGPD